MPKQDGNHDARPPWCSQISSGGNIVLPSQINSYWSKRIDAEKQIFRRAAGVEEVPKSMGNAHVSNPWMRVQSGELAEKIAADHPAALAGMPEYVPQPQPSVLLQVRQHTRRKIKTPDDARMGSRLTQLKATHAPPARPPRDALEMTRSGLSIRDTIGPLVVHAARPIIPIE